MIEKNNSDCVDCKSSFRSLKKDGTKRQRCFDCQKIYNDKYYKNCPTCNNSFRCMFDDGRVYDKCMKCYHEVREKRNKELEHAQPCSTINCNNKTLYSLCSYCFREKKMNEDQYMISRCTVCNDRFKGNFKFCSDDCKNSVRCF